MSGDDKALDDAIRRHLPEGALDQIQRFTPMAGRSAAGRPMVVVEAYDGEMEPLKASIGTSDGESVLISVRYDDGRRHKEKWVDRFGAITDGQQYQPVLWASGLGSPPRA